MRVLITGGAGFIGSHVADRLLARGDQVLVLDNFATGRRDNLSAQDGLTVAEGTIADAEFVSRETEAFRPELVVHAAASYKDPEAWLEDSDTNVRGTVNVVRAAQAAGASRLIYFQTSLCYGLHPKEQPITLAHSIDPTSSYAISKTAGEQYIQMSGLDYVSFRLANAYGPRNVSGPLPTFYHRLTAGKRCFVVDTRRDFIFVQDLVDVVLRAIDGRGAAGPYHIATGSDYAIKELFDTTVEALGVELDEPVPVRERSPDDAYTILLDPSVTVEQFGPISHTPLAEGVAAAVAYYRQYGVTETYTHLRQTAD